ncbi:MAG: STAS domain-containing protein [Gemmatimonadetes bacterium]|nr:STAS domain-containing protein [Gemmatimonadota bacterium]
MLECRTHGDTIVVKVTVAQIQSTVAATFRNEVVRAVSEARGPVVLNLENVEFVDSSGVGAMVAIFKGLERGRTMVLCSPKSPVRSLLELTRMDKIFRVYATESEALGSFAETS